MIWSFGQFELDEENCELRRNGSAVELRRKVFDVLRYLVTQGNRLVSKEELLQRVWAGETTHEAVVAQNIAILRRVLEDTREEARIIQTVHGRGYRFVASVAAQRPQILNDPRAAATHPDAPFVGREAVMQELRRLLHAAIEGSGRFVAITGEAGIGKTRTAEELALEARALGVRVLEGRCHEGEGAPPYWPWMQILRAAADDDRASVLTRLGDRGSIIAHLLGELPQSKPLDSAEARFRLFDGITAFLSRLARTQPLLLIFDDLHWADEATLHLLRFFSREARALPLLVLGTSRDVDVRAEGTARLLPQLIGGAHVHRVYLNRLSHAEIRELAHTLERHLGESALREVHALTEGNPFFVHEVLQLFEDGGPDAGPDERWRLELPERVREVIGLRLQGLGEPVQRVLGIASVIGRDFSLAVLERVAELPRSELLGLLDTAVRARIVREVGAVPEADRSIQSSPSGQYSFAHALIRESLYGALSEPERARLHEQVGRALEAAFGVDADAHLDDLARHFYRAASGGDVERAVSYCVRAAHKAQALLAFEQAIFHYQRALDALATRLPVDEQQRFELKLALGIAQFYAGEDGNPALLGAAEIARRLARPELLGRVVLAMCGWPRIGRVGRTANPALYPLLAEAVSGPQPDNPVLRSRLLSAMALNCPRETPLGEQVMLSQQALERARELGDDEALHDALQSRLHLMQAPSDGARRLALAGELLAVAERLGQKERMFSAHEMRMQPMIALGDMAGAERELALCAQLADELRLPRCSLQVMRMRLERALGDGRFDEIRPMTEEAVRVRGKALVSPGYLVSIFVWLTFESAWRGDRAWFERHIQRMSVDIDKALFLRTHVAYLHALFGRLDDARACYGTLLESSILDDSQSGDWLMTLALIGDAVATCADREGAEQVYARLLPYHALNVVHFDMLVYIGSCAHWLGRLAALIGQRDAAAAHFEAALEMNASLGARPALARTYYEYARMLLGREPGAESVTPTRGALARARFLLRESTELAEKLGMRGLLREARRLAD